MVQKNAFNDLKILSLRVDSMIKEMDTGRISGKIIEKIKILYHLISRVEEKLPKKCIEDEIVQLKSKKLLIGNVFSVETFEEKYVDVYNALIGVKMNLNLINEKIPPINVQRKKENKSEKEPLVSVLIPTYERPYFFTLALESALDQTYENIEIIVSDNGPSLDTEELIGDYIKVYRNIRYYHLNGGNVDDNYDNCWNHMSDKSEYVNFLMDDDLFAPDKIEIMVKCFLENDNVAIVTSYRQNIDENGEVIPDSNYNELIVKNSAVIDRDTAGQLVLLKCMNLIGEPTTVLFKKEYAEGRYRGWTGKEGRYNISDFPLWLRLLEHGDMAYFTKPLSFFRHHGDNDSKGLRTVVSVTINMALQIQTAWNRKIYLTDSEALHQAICSWMDRAVPLVKIMIDGEATDEDSMLLQKHMLSVYRELSHLYAEKNPGKIIFQGMDEFM